MKSVGVIGGLSWDVTSMLYRRLNILYLKKTDYKNQLRIVIHSVNNYNYYNLAIKNDWIKVQNNIHKEIDLISNSDIDILIINCFTLHNIINTKLIKKNISFINLYDTCTSIIRINNYKKIGIVGTSFIYSETILQKIIPNACSFLKPAKQDIEFIDKIIKGNIWKGKNISIKQKFHFKTICEGLITNGAEKVFILCTDLAIITENLKIDNIIVEPYYIQLENIIKSV